MHSIGARTAPITQIRIMMKKLIQVLIGHQLMNCAMSADQKKKQEIAASEKTIVLSKIYQNRASDFESAVSNRLII